MNSLPYFIYLDSKIIGTAKQITVFFQNGIFSKENTTILIKKYKHKSADEIANIFKRASLKYQFVSADEIDKITAGVVFYPFNAQSNCRVVANRNLKHVFITHGESNKVASIKPIIRIYDHVITSGQRGIDRYLENEIFYSDDVHRGRLIKMGDTFIGKTGLNENQIGQKVIFYAPTWEGGIESENYSSLANIDLVVYSIVQLSYQYDTKFIVVKPHPNTGYRDEKYMAYLLTLLERLRKDNLTVAVFEPNLSLSLFQKWKLRKLGIYFRHRLSDYSAVVGLCDVSAIEAQFLNENIDYFIFCKDSLKARFLQQNYSQYYQSHAIDVDNLDYQNLDISMKNEQDFMSLKNYVIDESLRNISINQRVNYLVQRLDKYGKDN